MSAEQPDLVNHPPHYSAHPSGVECIVITEHMGFNLGNAMKYVWRADEKGNALEDLAKARWYIEREIQRRQATCCCEVSPPEFGGALPDRDCAVHGEVEAT